jgi:23S rRNA pseudouridine1911/1915/1917 synthase
MEDIVTTIIVEAQGAGQRLDRFCTDNFPDLSRERIKKLIESGDIAVNEGIKVKPSTKIEEGWQITCIIPEAEDSDPIAENIPLDILYEDDDVIVINKSAGMVVHPATGNWSGTLVNALLYHCQDSLSGIGGVKRPGIVHRLDKDTSGVMIAAKNDTAHAHLSAQLADRTLSRVYHALVWDAPVPLVGTIDLPIGRDHKNRLKQAVKRGSTSNGQHAVTHYKTLQSYADSLSFVECRLDTGRTHQIRVHMQAKGYPLVGDPLYGAQKTLQLSRVSKLGDDMDKDLFLNFPRQALHAHEISFLHPNNHEKITIEAPMAKDIVTLLESLKLK